MQFFFYVIFSRENYVATRFSPPQGGKNQIIFSFFFNIRFGPFFSKRQESPQEEENWVKHLNILIAQVKRKKKQCLNLGCGFLFRDLVATKSFHVKLQGRIWCPPDFYFIFPCENLVMTILFDVGLREMTQWPPRLQTNQKKKPFAWRLGGHQIVRHQIAKDDLVATKSPGEYNL